MPLAKEALFPHLWDSKAFVAFQISNYRFNISIFPQILECHLLVAFKGVEVTGWLREFFAASLLQGW